MRPITRLAVGLAGLLAILLGVAMALPDHVNVARSVTINAPEGVVYTYVNNLRRFPEWSPWAARDPNARRTFSGPAEGRGARMEWESDEPSVGSGSMQIRESLTNRRVELAIVLEGADEATAYYDLVPSGSGSRVTWGYHAAIGNNPLKRWRGLMLDRWVGSEFEDGLARLKALVEGNGRPAAAPSTVAPASPVAPAGPARIPAQQ
jgi:uncharacterized membrane protein